MNFSSGNNWSQLESSISLYQLDRDAEVLDRLWTAVSVYVRNYPRLAFRQRDEDIASEFYLYISERKETLFEKFNLEQGGFRTFLSLRLHSHYLNFVKRNRKHQSKDRVVYSDKEEFFSEASEKGVSESLRTSSLFPDCESDPLNYLVLKLHYLDFFTEEDFIRLKEYTGKKYTELLEEFEKLQDQVADKKRRRLKADDRLGALYLDLLVSQEQPSTGFDEKKEKEISEIRCRILEEYHRIHEFVSFKGIAGILGVPETKVANIIVYQRKVMEKKIYGYQLLTKEDL